MQTVGFAPVHEQVGGQVPATQVLFCVFTNPAWQIVQFVFKSAERSLHIVQNDGFMPLHSQREGQGRGLHVLLSATNA